MAPPLSHRSLGLKRAVSAQRASGSKTSIIDTSLGPYEDRGEPINPSTTNSVKALCNLVPADSPAPCSHGVAECKIVLNGQLYSGCYFTHLCISRAGMGAFSLAEQDTSRGTALDKKSASLLGPSGSTAITKVPLLYLKGQK